MCKEQISNLMNEVKKSYESPLTRDEAQKLAGQFLHAMFTLGEDMKVADLDSRNKKSALKALKATVYLEAATKTDKKPADSMLEAIVNSNISVQSEQNKLDDAEVLRDSLQTYFNIFKEAHVFFRGICEK